MLQDALTLGSLVAFLQYSQRFFRPISDLSEKFNVLQGAMASSERIFALLDTPVEIVPPPRGGHAGAAPAPIRFEHVTFAYVPGEPVLQGRVVRGAAGPARGHRRRHGLGQDHDVNLLLRFYDVQDGRITIDGVDIRELDLASLRAQFGLVLQDVHLFSGTIAGNVRLGHADINDAAVRRAVDAVHAGPFIDRLPRRARRGGGRARQRRCRWGRSSCCRSRARWRSIRRCSFSTRRRRASTPKPSC